MKYIKLSHKEITPKKTQKSEHSPAFRLHRFGADGDIINRRPKASGYIF